MSKVDELTATKSKEGQDEPSRPFRKQGSVRSGPKKMGSKSKDEVLEPLRIGDFITLQCTDTAVADSVLRGDLTLMRLGVQQKERRRDALNFDELIFRVCPMLNYRQRTELDVFERSLAGRAGGTDDTSSASAVLRARVKSEEEGNDTLLAALDAGEGLVPIK